MKENRKKTLQISILGCGWLGLPLAEYLSQKRFSIKGSVTSEEKQIVLQQKGIETFCVRLSEKSVEGNIPNFLEQSEIVIINIPPKVKDENSESFVKKIKNLLPFIEKSKVKKVIFISSTSVFADAFPIAEITNETQPNPITESGKQLVEVEKLLLSNPNFQTVILRFGGLVGENRHPIYHLSGKTNVPNPDAPINLISRENCITCIEKMIVSSQEKLQNKIINAVDSVNLTRKEFYTAEAKRLGLKTPLFDDNTISKGKRFR